ncbi:hypothetical protein HY522_08975 [bacterium]|nr:hypothetical protein [bacterium]
MDVFRALEMEERRLQRGISRLIARPGASPNGCLSIKTISGRRYAYVVRRVRGRHVSVYAGPAGCPEVLRLGRTLGKARNRRNQLRLARTKLRRIQRALTGFRADIRPEVNLERFRRLPRPRRGDIGELGPAIAASMAFIEGRDSIRRAA